MGKKRIEFPIDSSLKSLDWTHLNRRRKNSLEKRSRGDCARSKCEKRRGLDFQCSGKSKIDRAVNNPFHAFFFVAQSAQKLSDVPTWFDFFGKMGKGWRARICAQTNCWCFGHFIPAVMHVAQLSFRKGDFFQKKYLPWKSEDVKKGEEIGKWSRCNFSGESDCQKSFLYIIQLLDSIESGQRKNLPRSPCFSPAQIRIRIFAWFFELSRENLGQVASEFHTTLGFLFWPHGLLDTIDRTCPINPCTVAEDM